MKYNPFKNAREISGISINQISKETNINRRIVSAIIDKGSIGPSKFEDVITIANFLKVNIYKFIRENFDCCRGEIYEDEMDAIINRLVEIRINLIYNELTEFSKIVNHRVDDFDVKKILVNKTNLHKLIALNSKLKNNEISIHEALRRLPLTKEGVNHRKKI